MKKDYIIWTPRLTSSNGVRVLHILAKNLESRGYNVSLYSNEPYSNEYKYTDKISKEMKEHSIVIYPEVVSGNPLRIKNVVRYVLFYPGENGGEKSYHQSETIFTFHKEFYESAHVLTIPYIDAELFYNDGLEKTQDCCFVYKGGKCRNAKETEGLLEINMGYPKKREELAEILRRTRTLYSYDNCSAILDEAKLCGAEIKIITPTGIDNYIDEYKIRTKDFESQLDNFVAITQELDYTGKLQKKIYPNIAKRSVFYFKYILNKYILKDKEKEIKYKNRIRGF